MIPIGVFVAHRPAATAAVDVRERRQRRSDAPRRAPPPVAAIIHETQSRVTPGPLDHEMPRMKGASSRTASTRAAP